MSGTAIIVTALAGTTSSAGNGTTPPAPTFLNTRPNDAVNIINLGSGTGPVAGDQFSLTPAGWAVFAVTPAEGVPTVFATAGNLAAAQIGPWYGFFTDATFTVVHVGCALAPTGSKAVGFYVVNVFIHAGVP